MRDMLRIELTKAEIASGIYEPAVRFTFWVDVDGITIVARWADGIEQTEAPGDDMTIPPRVWREAVPWIAEQMEKA